MVIYRSLPLTDPQDSTQGVEVATGNQSWTLFLNTENFKGPATFFLPTFFSRPSLEDPRLEGLLLDTRPSDANRALQMETQYIPGVQAQAEDGTLYARIAPTLFPATGDHRSRLVHQVTAYSRAALWDRVENWFNGGETAAGAIDPAGALPTPFTGEVYPEWTIVTPKTPEDQEYRVDWSNFSQPLSNEPDTIGIEWDPEIVLEIKRGSAENGNIMLPEFYRLEDYEDTKVWRAVAMEEVPPGTGLVEYTIPIEPRNDRAPYLTPEDPESPWLNPGPVAGPFTTLLGVGSQERAEKIHRHWDRHQQYLAPPRVGALAYLDPALIVEPPTGLEVGYVPIVTRQESAAEPLDTDGDGVPDYVEGEEGLDPNTKNNDVFNNHRLFVMQTYRDFLQREPDEAGLLFWTDVLGRLGMQVVLNWLLCSSIVKSL
ncbi:MAG: hypothetical protein ACFCBW_01580 [Candidatus Competibacterales bacterium]